MRIAKSWKKNNRRNYLTKKKKSNEVITLNQLISELNSIGLKLGDSVLVHSSMSKIGFLEEGPLTLINAIEKVIGKDGNLLMPSFPAEGRNKTYLESHKTFDVKNTQSKMGVITEFFRLQSNVKRSLHPTDSICARGPLASYFTNTHFSQPTPYNEFSPFRKLCDKEGKILMLGTTLNGACSNLHTLEDAVDFKYPVYDKMEYEVEIIDEEGHHLKTKTKVHNPDYSAKRNCDLLKPIFEKEKILINGTIGEAKSMLIDANGLFKVMLKYYEQYGVTMYTPNGENGKLKITS